MASIDTVAATTMRVVCGKDELAEKLQIVGRGVSTRTTVQILAGIMLRAAAGPWLRAFAQCSTRIRSP